MMISSIGYSKKTCIIYWEGKKKRVFSHQGSNEKKEPLKNRLLSKNRGGIPGKGSVAEFLLWPIMGNGKVVIRNGGEGSERRNVLALPMDPLNRGEKTLENVERKGTTCPPCFKRKLPSPPKETNYGPCLKKGRTTGSKKGIPRKTDIGGG